MTSVRFNVRVSFNAESALSSLYSWQDLLSGRRESSHQLARLQSPITAMHLSLEELERRVISPLKFWGELEVGGHSLPISCIERVEIRMVTIQGEYPNVFEKWGAFEYSGIDVSKELIKDAKPWDPKIGADDTPEAISVDLLFDRLVTSELLRTASRQLFRDRHFARSVEQAFVCLNNAVKSKSEITDRDGADLMRHVFSKQSPSLKLNALQSQSDKDEHDGFRDIFAGAMTGVRNPRAHESAWVDTPAVALELLALANHLMGKLEAATKFDGVSP